MRRLGALALLLTLTACSGGNDGDEPEGGATPPDQSATEATKASTLTVVLRDTDEPTALFPLEDLTCTSINPDEQVAGGEAPTPVKITVTAKGDVLDEVTLPETGGTFDDAAGCTWEVTFEDLPTDVGYNVALSSFNVGAGSSASPGGTVELAF